MKSLTEQIIELMPEENHPHTYSSENADIYDAYSRGFNKCRTEMINKIPEILSLIRGEQIELLEELLKLAQEDINFGAEHQQMVSTKVQAKIMVLLEKLK